MPDAKIRALYSAKRKKDYVTFLAVFLFIVMLAFQLYLILLLPYQLRRAETLEIHVARQSMLLELDHSRTAFRYLKPEGYFQKEEVKLLKNVFDRLALHVREHQADFTLAQLGELTRLRRRLQAYIDRWIPHRETPDGPARKARYCIGRETIDKTKYVRMLERRIREQEESHVIPEDPGRASERSL